MACSMCINTPSIHCVSPSPLPDSTKTNEEREQTLNQLLTEMDGFTPDTGVVFLGATNRWGLGCGSV